MGKLEGLKQNLKLRTIGSKVLLALILGGLFISGTTQIIVSKTIKENEIQNTIEKEATDINYMEDYISQDPEWSVRDYTLYKGEVEIGDGNTNGYNASTLFEEVEAKTGTFFYTFIHKDYMNPDIYNEIFHDAVTNYVRVAGSTKGLHGNSIVGTFMDKAVSDHLDKHDEYTDYANVLGVKYYCTYRNLKNKNGNVIGAIVAGRTMEDLHAHIMRTSLSISVVIFVAIAIMITALSGILISWIRAIRKSQRYLKRIENGKFPDRPLIIKTRDEMEDIAKSINEMTISLKEKERLGAELSVATDIQASMLPNVFPAFPGVKEFDIYATMKPAREVGGDFYDYFMINENKVGMVVADVSGKGVPAALFMVIAKIIIKNHLTIGRTPARTLTLANDLFTKENKMGLFITCWIGVVDLESGILSYANAGHNPPYLISKDGTVNKIKASAGFVLGGLNDFVYKQHELKLNIGDKICLYTDGVTEAMDKNNVLFGEDRLTTYLSKNKDKKLLDTINGLSNEISTFSKGVEQSDDITMLMFELNNLIKRRVFKADKAEFENVVDFINKHLRRYGASSKVYNQIKISVEEIFVNIASYAYEEEGNVEVSVVIENDIATISFKDSGVPFNPLERNEPDVTLTASERDIGGLGIFISKKMMDDVRYEYVDGHNVLTLIKKIKD